MRKRITLEGFVAGKEMQKTFFTGAVIVLLLVVINFVYYYQEEDSTLKQTLAKIEQKIKRIMGIG